MSEIALTMLLNTGYVEYGPGVGCARCPYSTPHPGEEPNPGDPDEGYYDCALLHAEEVWGEDPICADEEWKQAAAVELERIRCSSPAARKAGTAPSEEPAGCDCIDRVNAMLAVHERQLDLVLNPFTGEARIEIATMALHNRRRKSAIRLQPSFCPFCGIAIPLPADGGG